jgi:hypothetical protein
MERVELAQAAALAGAVAAPLVLLARNRLAFALSCVLLAVAEAGLAFALVPDQISAATGSFARIGASVTGLLGLGVLAVLFARFPGSVPAALLAVAPVRISVAVGGEEASLLVPLYVVLSAAVLALLYRLGRRARLRPLPLLIALPAGAYVAFAGISLLWSRDPRQGAIELFFFLFTGVLLVAVVAQASLTAVVSRGLACVLLASTTVVAAIGLVERWTQTLLVADELQSVNAYTSFFRVASIFNDPSVYGRYLALGIVVLFVLIWLGRIRSSIAFPLLAILCAGFFFSYSQSSFVALAVAVAVVTLLAGDRQARRVVAVTAAVVFLAGAALVTAAVQDESARRATSGRWGLVTRTAPVFVDNPVVGVGVGAQAEASGEVEGARASERKNVSHTTPLTVAAELGVLGLGAYLAFLYGAARSCLLVRRREPALGLSLVGALTVLVVHSLSYGGFFDDPFIWLVVGLSAASLTAPAAEPRSR